MTQHKVKARFDEILAQQAKKEAEVTAQQNETLKGVISKIKAKRSKEGAFALADFEAQLEVDARNVSGSGETSK